tara:strand:+ start:1228 stop:2289 length:1062 start_codon:yes stop_codon:yes gene_type:complete
MKKIILITGSTGLVGSESVKFFLEKGFTVVGIDNNKRKFFFGDEGSTYWIKKKLTQNKSYIHHNISVTNYNQLKDLFYKYKKKISLIIHCAAQPSHDWAYKDPLIDFDINSKSTLYLLELLRKFSPKAKFILTSTNKVYGDNPNKLRYLEKSTRFELESKNKFFKGISEKMSIDDCKHSLFGVSKTYGDLITQEYGKNYGLKTIVFRAGCISGPNHSGALLHGFLSYLVKSCILKKEYTIIGYKGKQVRDNIHSYDLVKCFWEFFRTKDQKGGEVYNIGGGRKSNCSILEAIEYIEKRLKLNVSKKFLNKSRIGDHKWYVSDNSKFKKHYPNWKQKYNYKMIINEIINQLISK